MGVFGKDLFSWLSPGKPEKACRIIVKDESGAPVKGVRVQLCSDLMCSMGETDDKGIATFKDLDEMTYTVHVLRVPEGFAEDRTEYEVREVFGDTTITLKAGVAEDGRG